MVRSWTIPNPVKTHVLLRSIGGHLVKSWTNRDLVMGVWSLHSGNVYRYANGRVTVWEPWLQTWIVRPARHHGHHVRADTEIMLRLIRPHHPP